MQCLLELSQLRRLGHSAASCAPMTSFAAAVVAVAALLLLLVMFLLAACSK